MPTERGNTARFRFYAELNDFLPEDRRRVTFQYRFAGSPAVKDAVAAIGVPHPEVDLVVVNGVSVGWDYHLTNGDRVSVYPVFEALDISPIVRLRPEPLRAPRFVLDVHLGRLARWLRMLGFDSLYRTDYDDAEIIDIAAAEHRIILTRDQGLLKNSRVTHGYWVRTTNPKTQLAEIVDRFDLRSRFAPFTRCMECNGETVACRLDDVTDQVPPKVRKRATDFRRCTACGKAYWAGSHVARMQALIDELREPGSD